ncbi:Nucleic acid-binding,-like fold-protein [Arachis hypogaea]|uniref:Nucleic acid-binding,-like fold-protein n=1 Tax=Arachis hypogaea TaxID=3818 RepID=A0A6B9VCN6_ARAHY|nr:Nucleic acid-binding,-like fold-protein [Arachis hypogaea]
MEQTFDADKDISPIPEKSWCLKVRILRMWKPIVEEGKVYVLANFTIDSNALKFKPTKHDMRIIFKRDTLVSCVEDTDIPVESFEFLPTKGIISSARDDIFLIDFIGLLSAKSDLISFEKKAKKLHYMKIELDDLSGSEKLSCKLWENYASDFVTLLEANKATKYITVLQFAKMKFYNGVMTITNTNSTTKIMVNAELEVVKKFRQRCRVVRHSPSEDFLSLTPYASISQIKETIEGRIVDESDTASFVLFENVASKFLGVSAADLLCAAVAKPGLQNLAISPGDCVHVSDGSGEVSRVLASTTPPYSKDATVCTVEGEPMVTHTPMKRICLKTDNGGSSHVPSTASRNLLPAFEKYMTKDNNDSRGTDI